MGEIKKKVSIDCRMVTLDRLRKEGYVEPKIPLQCYLCKATDAPYYIEAFHKTGYGSSILICCSCEEDIHNATMYDTECSEQKKADAGIPDKSLPEATKPVRGPLPASWSSRKPD